MRASPLFDPPTPRTTRRLRAANVVGVAVVLLVVALAAHRLGGRGQLRAELWEPFKDVRVWRTLAIGLGATVRAAVWCIVLSVVVGAVLGVARLSRSRWIRWPASVWVEFFRAVPSLLVIIFLYLAYSREFGDVGAMLEKRVGGTVSSLLGLHQLNTLGPLVVAIVLYHGAVFAEVFRAGLLAVARGQVDAGYSLGMTRPMLLRTVLMPQAVRVMLPALVSEAVRSLKATALGFAIGYQELLRTGQIVASAYHNLIPMALVLLVVYVAMCLLLSWCGRWIERREATRMAMPLSALPEHTPAVLVRSDL